MQSTVMDDSRLVAASPVDVAMAAAKRRRVLFTMVELGPGGVETNVLNLLSRLDPRRFEMSLFLHHDPLSALNRSSPRQVPDHVTMVSALKGAYRRWKLPFILRRLMSAARDCDVIVAAQEGRATLLACLAGRLLRKPVVGCIQFDWESAGRQMRKRQHWGLRRLCPGMSRIVACGEDSAAALSRIARIPKDRVTVIPNFVEVARITGQAEFPLPAWAGRVFAKPTVVAMGRLNHQKGFDVLIRAHANLRGRGIDHHLLILGDGELRPELMALANELKVKQSVFLPGFCESPFAVLKRGTVFALPSRFEGLPFALIEAMTLGLPVVAADCPSGPGEVLGRGRFGGLVPVDDAGSLATSLGEVLSDGAKRKEMAGLSLERAAKYADVHAMPAWEALLESVC